jgi:hypothetical protein
MLTTSMRGQKIDMAKMVRENAHKAAIGNAGLNARGDKITAGGTVLQTREQIMNDYNVSNPKAVKQVGLNNIRQEALLSPSEAAAAVHAANKQQMLAAVAEGKAEKPNKRRIADSEV